MESRDFEELLQGLREFKAIRAGTMKPSRVLEVEPSATQGLRSKNPNIKLQSSSRQARA
jgi:hypothetical protein